MSPDQNKVGSNSFTEQSSGLCLPPAPVNSPAADSTEAAVSGSSWFTGLTTVVDSPNSYPKWRNSDAAVSSLCSVTSCGANSTKLSSVTDPDIDDDDGEPPAKRQVLELTAADDDVSTTAAAAPLLGQLLSSTDDYSERHSDDDGDDDDEAVDDSAVDTATHSAVHSSNSDSSPDVTCMSSGDSVSDLQHEGLSYVGCVTS